MVKAVKRQPLPSGIMKGKSTSGAAKSPTDTTTEALKLTKEEGELELLKCQQYSEHQRELHHMLEAYTERIKALQAEASDIEQEDRKLVGKLTQQRRQLDAARRALRSSEDDVSAIQSRIKELEQQLAANAADSNSKKEATSPTVAVAPTQSGLNTSKASANAPEDADEEDITGLLSEVQALEAQVGSLRHRYVRSKAQLKEVEEDLSHEYTTTDGRLARLRKLQALDVEYTELRTSAHAQAAAAAVEKARTLQNQLELLDASLDEAVNEKRLMIQHLTEGARQRHNTLKELRNRFLPLSGGDFLKSVLAENVKEREASIGIYSSIEEEMTALQSYRTVLQRRCDSTSDRIHRLEYDLDYRRPREGEPK